MRDLALGSEAGSLRPLVAVRRINFTVQATAQQLEERGSPVKRRGGGSGHARTGPAFNAPLHDEVIANWTQLDPGPPDSNLEYKAIEATLAEAGRLLPDRHRSFLAILSHPKLQVKRVLDDWSDKGFMEASKNLRRLLVWDPDRRRVLRADQAILIRARFFEEGPWLVPSPRIIFRNGSHRLNSGAASYATRSGRPSGWMPF